MAEKKMKNKMEVLMVCLDSGLQSRALSLSACEEMQLHYGPLHQNPCTSINYLSIIPARKELL